MKLFITKLKISTIANLRVVSMWQYAMLAILFAFLFIQLLYWMLNWSLLWFFMSSSALTVIDKIDVIGNAIPNYLSSLPLWQSFAVIVLAILQGIVISVLVFAIKSQNQLDKKAFSGSTIASAIAIFSVGCVSCGTSIVAPIVGLFVSGASAGISQTISQYAVVFSLFVVLYAFYAVGKTAASIQARLAMDSTS